MQLNSSERGHENAVAVSTRSPADEYANLAARLLESDEVGGLAYRQLEVQRGIGYAILAGREELAAQLADLGDAVATVADRAEDINTAVAMAADEVEDLAGSVDILAENLTGAVDNLAEIVDAAAGAGKRRRWLSWRPGRCAVVVPGPQSAALPAVPVSGDQEPRVTLSAAEADDVWFALADAVAWRTQHLAPRAECGGCAEARALAGEQHGLDAAETARCPSHEQDDRLLSAYTFLRVRLAGGDLR